MEDKKWSIQSVGTALDLHIQGDTERDRKTNAMYEILVTGNGEHPLPETVRKHDTWIEEKKEEEKEGSRRQFEYKKGIIFLAVGEVLTLLVGAAAYLKK